MTGRIPKRDGTWKVNMRKIVLLLCVAAFASQISAHGAAKAVKFDEFQLQEIDSYYPYQLIDISKRIDRLIAQAKKMRGIKVYIIAYKARRSKFSYSDPLTNTTHGTISRLISEARLAAEDVVSFAGGFREGDSMEFWIGQKNSEPPAPTPTYERAEAFGCPTLRIDEAGMNFDESRPVVFSINVDPAWTLSYNWVTSIGNIIEGQGTGSIKVELDGNRRVTVFVEAAGLPLPCERMAYKTIKVGKRPYLVEDAVRFNYSYLAALVDSLIIQINNDPSLKARIVLYASRTGGERQMASAVASVMRMFAFRRYDMSRVEIVRGGYREHSTVDMWLLPPGVDSPPLTPSVDEQFVKIPPKKIKR